MVVATLVTPAGTGSLTEKAELLPGPSFVTVSVQVMLPEGATVTGPVLVIPRSTLDVPVHAAPSLLSPAMGPVYWFTSVKVGVPEGLATEISKMLPVSLLENLRLPPLVVSAAPYPASAPSLLTMALGAA